MGTECNGKRIGFQGLSGREVVGRFDGGLITSDGGGLLLREVERATRIIGQFAACFRDYRDSESIEHAVYDLVAQRVYGLALGYEDLNDHDDLRCDPLHGRQEGRFFHGYYRCYCYLPLYVFFGEHLLCARLRSRGSTPRMVRWMSCLGSWARFGRGGRRSGS